MNYNSGDPYIVETSLLQNKKDRYYFSETMLLKKDEMYISPFDLNLEYKSIELPRKPMLRFAVPIYSESSEKGILILNFLGDIILNDFRRATSDNPGTFSLLNNQGYWLFGDNPHIEWGFMFSDGKDKNYKDQFPQLWQQISNGNT